MTVSQFARLSGIKSGVDASEDHPRSSLPRDGGPGGAPCGGSCYQRTRRNGARFGAIGGRQGTGPRTGNGLMGADLGAGRSWGTQYGTLYGVLLADSSVLAVEGPLFRRNRQHGFPELESAT